MIAPKGHWYTHAPQEMHLLLSMVAAFSSFMEMAFTLQAFWQGRLRLTMAV